MELNFEGLEMQKLNIPTEQAQQVYPKNGVLCPAVMFTPRAMVVKLSKLAYFFAFSGDGCKKYKIPLVYNMFVSNLIPVWSRSH